MVGVIICPVCGYSFRYLSPKNIKERIMCPMCGHEFRNPKIFPSPINKDDKKYE